MTSSIQHCPQSGAPESPTPGELFIIVVLLNLLNNCILHVLSLHVSTRQWQFTHPSHQIQREAAFSVYAPQKWNTLPDTVRHATSVAIFKNTLKTSFINSILLSCVCACVHVSMCGCEWVHMYEFKCVCGEDVIHMIVYLHLHSSIDS